MISRIFSLKEISSLIKRRYLFQREYSTYHHTYAKAKYDQQQVELRQIQRNIELRCVNYDLDPMAVIDSLLNREKRRIVLDRLVIKDPNHGNILITENENEELRETLKEVIESSQVNEEREKVHVMEKIYNWKEMCINKLVLILWIQDQHIFPRKVESYYRA